MCYDISYRITLDSIEDYFENIEIDPQLEIDFSLSIHVLAQAFKKHPVILFEDGHLKLRGFEWGVIADYMDSPEKIKKMRNSMCNARSEKILGDKKSYWHRLRKKRCLIPVNGIFEHREIKGWKNKVPYYVQLKDREMFCIPGLYHYPNRPSNIETGEVTGTFSLITREANSLMKQIHNSGDQAFRMPLFLPKELELKWLDPELDDAGIAAILDYEIPSSELIYTPVYTIRSTKPRPDQGIKTDPFEWPNLPPLGQDDGELQKALF
ncbi:MAG TPA: SOS response-associated peptidase family protein [Chitinophagaceae bacterium]|nr:SOS response-associated peptidase family protein [Chitinophagaceae bacterium]